MIVRDKTWTKIKILIIKWNKRFKFALNNGNKNDHDSFFIELTFRTQKSKKG